MLKSLPMRTLLPMLLLLVCLGCGTLVWVRVAPALEVRVLHIQEGGVPVRVVALRTTPGRVQLAAGAPRDAAGWCRHAAARAAVNGGFFDPAGRSLGLRIAHGKRLAPLHG